MHAMQGAMHARISFSPEWLGLVAVDVEDLLHVGLEVLERTHVLRGYRIAARQDR
jgi:hypothetical protein